MLLIKYFVTSFNTGGDDKIYLERKIKINHNECLGLNFIHRAENMLKTTDKIRIRYILLNSHQLSDRLYKSIYFNLDMSKEQINDIKIVRNKPRLIQSYKYCEKNYIVYFEILYISHLCSYGKVTIYNPLNKVEYGKLLYNISPNLSHHYINEEIVVYKEMTNRYKMNISRNEIKIAIRRMFGNLPKETEFSLFDNFHNIILNNI